MADYYIEKAYGFGWYAMKGSGSFAHCLGFHFTKRGAKQRIRYEQAAASGAYREYL